MTERKHFMPYEEAWKKFVRCWVEYFHPLSPVVTDRELEEAINRDRIAMLRESIVASEAKKEHG